MIVNTENEITAIKNIQEKIERGELILEKQELIKQQFIKELESVKSTTRTEPSKAYGLEVQGLNYYIKKAFLGSFFYDQSREIFAPLAHYDADNHKKLEEFYNDRALGEKIALEKDKGIDVEISRVSDKSKQTAVKRKSHVEKLSASSLPSRTL